MYIIIYAHSNYIFISVHLIECVCMLTLCVCCCASYEIQFIMS